MKQMHSTRRVIVGLAAAALASVGALVTIAPLPGGASGGSAPDFARPTPAGATEGPARVAAAQSVVTSPPDVKVAANGDVTAQATLAVTTTADGGAGSLREAIETLAINAGGDTVVLEAGATYTLTCGGGGDLDHGNTPLIIQGNGATLTMAAGCNERILDNGNADLTIDGVQFANVTTTVVGDLNGGLVLTLGNLTLTGVTVNVVSITAEHTDLFRATVGGTITNISNSTFAGITITSSTNGQCGVFCTRDTNVTSVSISGTTINGSNSCGIFCSSDMIVTDTHIADTTTVDTTTTGYGSCGLFCNGDITISDSTITNSTFTDVCSSCGIFCSRDMTMTNSTITNTTFNDQSGNCAIFCGSDVIMTGSAIEHTTTITTGTYSDQTSMCGGVFCSNDVTMTNSRVHDTVTTMQSTGANEFACGGVFCSNDIAVTNSSITGTRFTSPNLCGGVFCSSNVTITNSTIADNIATSTAGTSSGVFDSYNVVFVYVTFVGNQSAGQPAIDNVNSFTSFGSVLANSGPGGNCDAEIPTTSQGYNFVDDTSCALGDATDKEAAGLDPKLEALADNGGPGLTMLPGTPAVLGPLVNAIPNAACQKDGAVGITTDERGKARPGDLVVGNTACDIGAVELQELDIYVAPAFTG